MHVREKKYSYSGTIIGGRVQIIPLNHQTLLWFQPCAKWKYVSLDHDGSTTPGIATKEARLGQHVCPPVQVSGGPTCDLRLFSQRKTLTSLLPLPFYSCTPSESLLLSFPFLFPQSPPTFFSESFRLPSLSSLSFAPLICLFLPVYNVWQWGEASSISPACFCNRLICIFLPISPSFNVPIFSFVLSSVSHLSPPISKWRMGQGSLLFHSCWCAITAKWFRQNCGKIAPIANTGIIKDAFSNKLFSQRLMDTWNGSRKNAPFVH